MTETGTISFGGPSFSGVFTRTCSNYFYEAGDQFFANNFMSSAYKSVWSGYESLGLRSSYSAWDAYFGTSDYSNGETVSTSTNTDDIRRYAKDANLATHGISGNSVVTQPPKPVTITAKYR